MSQNYMSGVPVKIAENYKPPKKLALTQSVSQRLSTGSSITAQVLERSGYDFGLEQTVLAKMNEWQRVRQRENCDRKERLRLHQQERQSVLDAKQKQMLTAVSYPSTDELSSDDDGDDSGHGTSSDASKSAVNTANMKAAGSATTATGQSQKRTQFQQQQQHQQQFSPPSCFNNILVPTVMPGQEKGQPFQSNIGGPVKSPHYSKFNFHEFENDTSSPFDNVELKTINDLDILAEVWNTSVAIGNADSSSKDNTPTGDDDSISTTNTPNVKTNQAVQLPNQPYGNQQSIHSNPFPRGAVNIQAIQTNHMPTNHSDATAAISPIPIANSHFYGNQIHYNHQTDPNQSYHTMANSQLTFMNTAPLNNNPSYVIGQQFVPNRYTTVSPTYDNQVAAAAAMALPNHNNGVIVAATTANSATTNSMYGDKTVITTNSIQAKSKWKSVPDIMQEINTELQNSEGRRGRITSECEDKDGSAAVINQNTANKQEDTSPTYEKLSISSRDLARNISSMGFPLEQVARITEKFGNDDKKIIDHLIRLGELLDLGFEEQKISDALVKFDNNKEKALDFLIS